MSIDLHGLPPELLAQLSREAISGKPANTVAAKPAPSLRDELAHDVRVAVERITAEFTSEGIIGAYIYRHELRSIVRYIGLLNKTIAQGKP